MDGDTFVRVAPDDEAQGLLRPRGPADARRSGLRPGEAYKIVPITELEAASDRQRG